MAKPKRAVLTCIASRLGTLDTRTAQPAPKTADPELKTADHQRWRAEVLRRAGGMCQGPGCGRTGVRLFADHIRERQDGGALLDPANGQAYEVPTTRPKLLASGPLTWPIPMAGKGPG